MTEIYYDQHSDSSAEESLVGNSEGIDLLKGNRRLGRELADIRKILNNMSTHMAERDEVILACDRRIEAYDRRIERLELLSVGARDIRKRFLEHERLRHIDDKSQTNRNLLERGNSFAHEPDALLDAYIYVDGELKDTDTYHLIYGANPEQVVSLCKFCFPQGERYHAHNGS